MDDPPKRPPHVPVGDWVEALIQRAIAEGEFDGIDAAPDPMAGVDLEREDAPTWWVEKLCEREGLSATPTLLALRGEAWRLRVDLRRIPSERELRARVADLNARIEAEQLANPAPLVAAMPTLDVEALVREWAG